MPAVQREWTDEVDRRAFIPDVVYVQREPLGSLIAVSRQDEPDFWEKLIASDEPIVTKLDPITLPDGSQLPFWPASSSSAPSIMNVMLHELRIEPGHSVLEIGTGTGWNAAVMRQAGAVVTTVEIDSEIADHARASLTKVGYADVVVVTGDGELGVPERAPYDRLIATAAVRTLPYAWVNQVRDGGLIVFPYTGEHCGHGLGVLTVRDGTAFGTIGSEGRAGFMPLRGRGLSQAELQAIKDVKRLEIVVRKGRQDVTIRN